VRLGLSSVRGIGDELAKEIVAGAPYSGPGELARRIRLDRGRLEALATAGAFGCFEGADGEPLERREALWSAGAAARSRPGRLPGIVEGAEAPRLPGMDPEEEAIADLWATGVAPNGHPTRFLREALTARGVVPADELRDHGDGERVRVAGVVTHRQRPATAGGVTFVNLEDETGLINVVCSVGFWKHYRKVAQGAAALLVRGKLERTVDGVVNVVADRFDPLPVAASVPSRDFR
jgi:error-prone DNA polymerase